MNKKTDNSPVDKETEAESSQKDLCGIIMPISGIDGCTESHWVDVISIINDSITAAGFEPNIVSNADDVGVIQKRIVQNLYSNPMVVCDVSGKNPNVMFELGMRLAFNKPTVIIKDDKTSYSFDTSAIEHLEYPRDLRYNTIEAFKKKLAEKIKATFEKSKGPDANTFLKNFGEFTVAKIEEKEISIQKYLIDELSAIKDSVRRLTFSNVQNSPMTAAAAAAGRFISNSSAHSLVINIPDWSDEKIDRFQKLLDSFKFDKDVKISSFLDGTSVITVKTKNDKDFELARTLYADFLNKEK